MLIREGGIFMKPFQLVIGSVLILIGGLSLLTYAFHLDTVILDNLWFLFVLIPGLYFEINYFQTRKSPGQLVPGGILSAIGLISLFEILTKWQYSDFTAPLYLLTVAFGLYQLYYFDVKDKGLLIPITILCTIALFLYLNFFVSYLFLFSIFLIGLGLYILFKKR